LPIMYRLFEYGETVICGLPDMDMAADKWRQDLLPVIERSRYRDLLPTAGSGSRGGQTRAVRFRNGATLRFMSGGGGDKSRAGFTSRVLVVTETDGLDESSEASREADKLTQMEGRTRAFGSRRRVYLECTVSIEEGRTWREYQAGTTSRIVLRCPLCGGWVSPGRDALRGWQEADSAVDARLQAHFTCPACNQAWSEEHRRRANQEARLLHRGQDITPDGGITGEPPRTDTLGFRWSAVNNLFVTAGDAGADEWRASRAADEENAEREMLQFVWALPYKSAAADAMVLTAQGLIARQAATPRGLAPEGTTCITVGVDLGKYLAHWAAVAWSADGGSVLVDYSRFEVPTERLGVEAAIVVALREFRDRMAAGWGSPDGSTLRPDLVWIDAGYQAEAVYSFAAESGETYWPTLGRGAGQEAARNYNRPKNTGSTVKLIGDGYHVVRLKGAPTWVVEVDADHWKSWLCGRLTCATDAPGAMLLFRAMPRDHMSLAKHLTAEKETQEFLPGKGIIRRWQVIRRANHWLDACYLAAAAGHAAGVRLPQLDYAPPPAPDAPRSPVTAPDGRPYFIMER
ncbi:MAG: phage terminase large subunit family protein, partial [Elusimicrobia bacterium]|nr:phage terminase large subunit family protein [Elusimicrobiota bacterium]